MRPVAIVGAGPVGLTLALRLAQFDIPTTVLERRLPGSGEGSKALCMQRETLESWAGLGLGAEIARRGVAWRLGRTYFRDVELFQTELPGTDEHFPPFVNISQTEVERLLVGAADAEPQVSLHWGHALVGLTQTGESVRLRCTCPNGDVEVEAAYVVGTDGAGSVVRRLAGIGFPGHSYDDQFLIADIRARLPFPAERRFWFDPPWNPGRTVLIHPQPEDVWRIDWQVPPDFDLPAERASGRLDERIRRIVGAADYEPVWLTVYRFQQRMASRFRDRRVFLAGDAAHVVSPFGARGLNSGICDATNLAWRLAFALTGRGSGQLLDSYAEERMAAARENLAVTAATMRFMAPPTAAARAERDAILLASVEDPAARALVDSGRLAVPAAYAGGSDPMAGRLLSDAPVQPVRGTAAVRLRELVGPHLLALHVRCCPAPDPAPGGPAATGPAPVGPPGAGPVVQVVAGADVVPGGAHPVVRDVTGRVCRSLAPDGRPRVLTVRPDAYVAGVAAAAGAR